MERRKKEELELEEGWNLFEQLFLPEGGEGTGAREVGTATLARKKQYVQQFLTNF